MNLERAALLTLAGFALAALPARADEPAEKRAEGRYFVEAAEIMLRANDFDAVIAEVDADGTGPGAAVTDVAELSSWNMQQPKITIGLNRPGKTSISFSVLDFELSDRRIPQTYEDAGDQIVTTPLLPPGIVFQRQRSGLPDGVGQIFDDDFVPNWGEEYGFVRRTDFKSLDLSVHRNIYEHAGEKMAGRLRWIAGLRYAQLQQKLSVQVGFAEEGIFRQFETRDFFAMTASAETHGLGPHFGLSGGMSFGKNKKFTLRAQGDVAMLPESTSARYGLSLVDNSMETVVVTETDENGQVVSVQVSANSEAPLLPGLGSATHPGDPFNAIAEQTDYTELTWLFEGSVGFRYRLTRAVSLGLDAWHLRWMNVLSQAGMIDTVHETATYAVIPGDRLSPDIQLRDGESILTVPRFDRREDVSFDGVSLNLRFEF